jgi:succinoglycan biosynthesis protein ExoA
LKISVIIPCFNERNFISKCIDSALAQDIGENYLEVLIIDGQSTDGTREIVSEYMKFHENVILIDNINRVTPFALNKGIRESTGDYIIIWGAHAEYSPDFIKNSLLLMETHPEVSCVGGPIKSIGNSPFGDAAAIAMSSMLGVGNAKHRFPEYEGYAEMACFPVFRRNVFEMIGMYDESLVKNQDDEFCFRLRLNGGKIYISPSVQSSYYTRSTPVSLFRQYFGYGKWRIAVLKKHKIPISYRQQIPVLFFSTLIILAIIGILLNNLLIGIILPILYFTILLIFSLLNVKKSVFGVPLYIPLAIFLLHTAYAAGFIAGVFKFIIQPSFARNRKN